MIHPSARIILVLGSFKCDIFLASVYMQSVAFGPRVRIILALGSSYLRDGMILASARMILAPC